MQIVKNRTSSLEAAVLFNPLKPQRNEILVPNRAAVPLGTFDRVDQEGQGQSRLRPGVVDHIFTDESSIQLPKESTDLIQNSEGKANFEYIEEVPVCDSATSYVYPRTARNINQEWRFVVNLPGEDGDNYAQAVKVEKCVKPGDSCNLFEGMGSRTVCRQKYSYKKMLALSDTGQQYIDSFRFPSCCVCYSKKVFGNGYAGLELLRTEEKTTNLFQEPTGDFTNTVRDIEAQVESTTEAGDDQDGLDYQEITTDISGSRKRRGGNNSKRRN
ncbi:uncharacterized protein LOC111699559 isoform X2 [Eurytemora carolleeae]|uniref:uncharacterized protein LOC111699559 isoform X2 n=1 Tax=Eurytemora carolleeae TaxID=1294199 RepID=UPI000C78D6E0|nr:uncharacterized protein LOC111699559 isoform X2 [Eurytemora carolleeae]|eukprot:XP_023326028.1 uncharacterized protein LOC111699559 isoform X2 [Eurytemora affinis]